MASSNSNSDTNAEPPEDCYCECTGCVRYKDNEHRSTHQCSLCRVKPTRDSKPSNGIKLDDFKDETKVCGDRHRKTVEKFIDDIKSKSGKATVCCPMCQHDVKKTDWKAYQEHQTEFYGYPVVHKHFR